MCVCVVCVSGTLGLSEGKRVNTGNNLDDPVLTEGPESVDILCQ